MKNITLLNELIKDEKKIDRKLYSSGPYWDYKNIRAASEIKKKGLEDFRGLNAGIGTSFADNLVLDFRNELNILSFPPIAINAPKGQINLQKNLSINNPAASNKTA